MGARGGRAHSAIAFDDFFGLLETAQDAIAYFSIPTVLVLFTLLETLFVETRSRLVKIAVLNRLGEVGNRAHLARLTELSSAFFQWPSFRSESGAGSRSAHHGTRRC